MVTMMTSSDINMAIVQFGHKHDEENLKILARRVTKEKIAHWYFFEETADREFEIAALRPHYDFVYECIDSENFYEV